MESFTNEQAQSKTDHIFGPIILDPLAWRDQKRSSSTRRRLTIIHGPSRTRLASFEAATAIQKDRFQSTNSQESISEEEKTEHSSETNKKFSGNKSEVLKWCSANAKFSTSKAEEKVDTVMCPLVTGAKKSAEEDSTVSVCDEDTDSCIDDRPTLFMDSRKRSSQRFVEDHDKELVKMYESKGKLTKEFKKVLVLLAKRALLNTINEIKEDNTSLNDTRMILLQGALSLVNEVLQKNDFEVKGRDTMTPAELSKYKESSAHNMTLDAIYKYEIDRMRGSICMQNDGKITPLQTKGVRKSANVKHLEEITHKMVEIGFLTQTPTVLSVLNRFMNDPNQSFDHFKRLGIMQRAKEMGQVLLNKLFLQTYEKQ